VQQCERCGVAFLDDPGVFGNEPSCLDCRAEPAPEPSIDAALIAATEAEILGALEPRCLDGVPALTAYLGRLIDRVAQHIPGACRPSRAVGIGDREVRSLALPSGRVVVSLGCLEFLEDEAELAFVLGHELAHVASGDVARHLVRAGLATVGMTAGRDTRRAWIWAAEDLMRLGYGRHREREADARALDALVALRYDAGSVARYLQRLEQGMTRPQPELADPATAHPLPRERLQQVERVMRDQARWGAALRVNREVFRRVAGPEALRRELGRAKLAAREPAPAPVRVWPRRLGWAAVATGSLALLWLLVELLLSG
jgi:predicted Zn-dependent protease